jgi:hypothetical protein
MNFDIIATRGEQQIAGSSLGRLDALSNRRTGLITLNRNPLNIRARGCHVRVIKCFLRLGHTPGIFGKDAGERMPGLMEVKTL